MNRGVPPTELNARTGEFTPPGMAAFARSNHALDCSVPVLTRPVNLIQPSAGARGHRRRIGRDPWRRPTQNEVQSRKPGRRAADPRHLRWAPKMAGRRPGGEQPVTERVSQRNPWLVLAGFLG